MIDEVAANSADATIRARLSTVGGTASGRLQASVTGLPQEGDTIGRFQFGSVIDEGTGEARQGASIIAKASADWTEDSCPTVLQFNVCAPGSSVAVKVAELDHNGNLTISGELFQGG